MERVRLAVENLAFGYPERPVGRDASLSVEPGEVLCLLGPNGCGKTTLFKTMLGLLPPQGGRVVAGDDDLSALSRPEIARRLAYVPQAGATPFPFKVADVVLMGRVAHRSLFAGPTADDRRAAEEALSQLGIAHLGDRDVTQLSGGQRQLVMIARALAQATPLVILDEPTASLDFGNQATVLGEVRRIAKRGASVILSTHDPNHALTVASRVALMRDGSLVGVGAPRDVLTSQNLEVVYGVSVIVDVARSGRLICLPAVG